MRSYPSILPRLGLVLILAALPPMVFAQPAAPGTTPGTSPGTTSGTTPISIPGTAPATTPGSTSGSNHAPGNGPGGNPTRGTASATQPASTLIVPARVAVEITRLLEPLRADGMPDYAQAINQICAEGIKAEDNAGIPLLQVLGIEAAPAVRAKVAQALGLDPAGLKPTYIPWSQFTPTTQPEGEAALEEVHKARRKPWQASDHPRLVAWLEANEPALNELVRLSRMKQFYVPLEPVPETDALALAGLPYGRALRDATRALGCRAALRLGKQDAENAWADALAIFRLARLVKSQPLLACHVLGVAMEWEAADTMVMIAEEGDIRRPMALRMIADTAVFTQFLGASRALEKTERFMRLDVVRALQRAGTWPDMLDLLKQIEGSATPLLESPAAPLPVALDFNRVMYAVNDVFDLCIPAFQQSNYFAGQNLLESLDRTLRQRAELSERKWRSADFAWQVRQATPEGQRELLSPVLSGLVTRKLGGTLLNVYRVDRLLMTKLILARLATGLAAYYADQGEYPPTLDLLAPRYLPQVPPDPFGAGKPFFYQRQNTGCRVYSVGPDGKDDGGVPEGYRDLVLRMQLPPRAR